MELQNNAAIKIATANGITAYPLTSPDANDGISWDSMGNDAPHDGNGIGHERGDHTDHRLTYELDEMQGSSLPRVAELASLSELLDHRRNIGR